MSSNVRIDLASPNQQSKAHKAIRLIWSSILSLLNQKFLIIALFSFKILSIRINRWWDFWFLFYHNVPKQQRQAYKAIRLNSSSIFSLFNQTVSYYRFVFIQYSFNPYKQLDVSFSLSLSLLYRISRDRHTKPYVSSDLQYYLYWIKSLLQSLCFHPKLIQFDKIDGEIFNFFLITINQISRDRPTKQYVSTHLQFSRYSIKQSLTISLFLFIINSIRINRSWDFCVLLDLTLPIQQRRAHKAIRRNWSAILSFL